MDTTTSFAPPTTPDIPLHLLRMQRPRRPGGSSMGRLMWRSRTRTAGIRFEWVLRTIGPVLRVVATWTDWQGQPRHTSFSVQCNGLEGALDRAIAARISCGAPLPDRADLLQRLQQEFATAPQFPGHDAARAPSASAEPCCDEHPLCGSATAAEALSARQTPPAMREARAA